MIIVTASDIVTGIATITIGGIVTDTATGSVIVTLTMINTMIVATTVAITITTDGGFGFSDDRSLGVVTGFSFVHF